MCLPSSEPMDRLDLRSCFDELGVLEELLGRL